MSQSDLSYDDWIGSVFDHAVPFYGQAWYFDSDADWWDPRPELAIAHLTRLFNDPGPLVDQFADGQIGQGLYYLVSSGASSHCVALTNEAVPLNERVICIHAMLSLFIKLFEPRCRPMLSHRDEASESELNRICYMWWDVMPLAALAKPSAPDPIHDACLGVMRSTLALPNPACQESALHGLGHWAHAYPEFTAKTIDAYLAANQSLRPELRGYAQAARSGCVN
jgi:hypothetical protein